MRPAARVGHWPRQRGGYSAQWFQKGSRAWLCKEACSALSNISCTYTARGHKLRFLSALDRAAVQLPCKQKSAVYARQQYNPKQKNRPLMAGFAALLPESSPIHLISSASDQVRLSVHCILKFNRNRTKKVTGPSDKFYKAPVLAICTLAYRWHWWGKPSPRGYFPGAGRWRWRRGPECSNWASLGY